MSVLRGPVVYRVGRWASRCPLDRWMVFVNDRPALNGGCITRRGALRLAERWRGL